MLLDSDPALAFVPYPASAVPNGEGPLSGLTLGVKDIFDVAGYPSGCGSPHMLALSGVKTRTAPIVQRMLDAGARFVGKTHTDELAFSLNGKNAHFGTPVNGGAPDRIPGGSSSGSAAAVSNRLCDVALGSDTGGSVRGPASHCGLFGIRPTQDRVTLEGCMPLAPSYDTPGYFTRDAETFVRVGRVFLGEDTSPVPDDPRLLVAADAFAMLGQEVRAVLAPVVGGIERALGQASMVEVAPEGFENLYWAHRWVQAREAWQSHGAMIERYKPPLGPGVGDRFAFGKTMTDAQVEEGRALRAQAAERLRRTVGADGVLVLPTMPDVAPLLTDPEDALNDYRNAAIHLLCLAGLSGLPQISMPLAGRLGAPLGISILGPQGSDLSLVRLAARLAG
jgi:amidase